MSFNHENDARLTEALQALQPTAEIILSHRPIEFNDATYQGHPYLLDEAMRQVLNVYAQPSPTGAKGSNGFLFKLSKAPVWTHRQSRAVANILLHQLRADQGKATAKAFATADPAPYEQPSTQTHVPVINKTFTPQYDIDLRAFPPGRFAVHMDGEWNFVIITELKRPSVLRGRFVWTNNRYANERLERGARTVRIQRGDTKEYIGVQKLSQDVYHGEKEELVQRLSLDPMNALADYGKVLNKCGHCGRSLTDPESRARGIGPDCWEHKHVPFRRTGYVNNLVSP